MNDSSDTQPTKRSTGRFRLVAASAAVAFAINILVSNDWCFGAFTAAFIAAVLVAIVDRLLSPLARRFDRSTAGRAAVGIMVAVVVGLSIQLTDTSAFRLVFEMDIPAAVDEVVAERRYAGGPGDQVMLLEFHTDLATLNRCLAQRGFVEDTEVVTQWHELLKGRMEFWGYMLGGLVPEDHRWRKQPPLLNPAVYRRHDQSGSMITLLCDPDTGWAYVLYFMP